MTLIPRDLFARTELHRTRRYKCIGDIFFGCVWCGGVKQTPVGEAPYLFKYTEESDGGTKRPINGAFCSINCMRSYHS